MTSVLTRVELLGGRLTDAQRDRYRTFMLLATVQEVGVHRRIVDRAAVQRTAHGLKGFDSLHLATALEYSAEEFHTFDKGLLKLAEHADFRTRLKIRKPSSDQLLLPLAADADGDPEGEEDPGP